MFQENFDYYIITFMYNFAQVSLRVHYKLYDLLIYLYLYLHVCCLWI